MRVRVTTIDVLSGIQIGESRIVNYDNPGARAWLNKHCLWAFHNGYGVAMNNVKDEPKPRSSQKCDNPHCPGHDDDAGEA